MCLCAFESAYSLLIDRDKTDPSLDGPPTESGPLEVRGLQPVLNPASLLLALALRLASRLYRHFVEPESKARQRFTAPE